MSIFIDQAIEEKDFFELRRIIAWELQKDPVFLDGECEECVRKIKESGLWEELQEKYDESVHRGGYKNNPVEWTEEYYFQTLLWLQDNFAYEKRILHIKEVGKVAFKDLLKEQEPVKRKRNATPNSPLEKQQQKGIYLVIGLLVILFLLLMKSLGR